MNFILRKGTPADAAATAQLARITFPDACPPELPATAIEAFIAENLSEQAFNRYLREEKFIVNLAVTPDGELLGYTLIDLNAPVPAGIARPAAYVSKIYVAPQARGLGIANALMRAAVEDARQHGARGLHLGTNVANSRSNSFYQKFGFEVVGKREFTVGGIACQDYIYALAL